MDLTDQTIAVRNERDFDAALQSNPKAVALFYAMWCPFCVRFLPVFEKAIRQNPDQFITITVEDQDALENRYQVNVVPTVLFFQNGDLAKRLDGKLGIGLNEKQLADFLNSL